MLGGNPNTPNNPFAPRQSWMSKQNNGSQNPYGFGLERLAGKLALQRNVGGMPTNTVPLPAQSSTPSPFAQQMSATGVPSQFWGKPWWEVPSQYWSKNEAAGIQGDWMDTLTPGSGHSYADYQDWRYDLAARGLLDAQFKPTKQYYEEIHNQSFNPIYNVNGVQTGTVRDYTYQPTPAQTSGPSVAGAAYAAEAQARHQQPAQPARPGAARRATLGGY